MKRLFSLLFVAMLAGQAWAQTTFEIGNLKYTITDAEKREVSVGKAVIEPKGDLEIKDTVSYNGVTYRVTEIDSYGFRDCWYLTSITLPESLTAIKNNAFANCTNMESFTIPSSVTTLGGYIFYNCKALTALTIPQSVTSIGGGLCSYCTKLTAITVEAGNANYSSVDGVLYNGDTLLVMYPIGKNSTSFMFPNTVTKIARSSFRGCTKLVSVTLDEALTSVAGYAFDGCSNLETINIPSSVTSIDDCTFKNCRNLKTIAIPASVTTIKNGAFDGCYNLTVYCETESAPAGWSSDWMYNTIIEGDFVFSPSSDRTANVIGYLGSETDITIPDIVSFNGVERTVTGIGNQICCGNTNVISITIPKTVTTIGKVRFRDAKKATSKKRRLK